MMHNCYMDVSTVLLGSEFASVSLELAVRGLDLRINHINCTGPAIHLLIFENAKLKKLYKPQWLIVGTKYSELIVLEARKGLSPIAPT
jgi:hypothetical protein